MVSSARQLSALIGGKTEPVEVTRRRGMRRLVLRVAEDHLRISCPYGVSEQEILSFVYSREAWILDTRRRQERESRINQEGETGGVIYWLGEPERVVLRSGERQPAYVDGGQIFFQLPEPSPKQVQAAFRALARQKLQELITGEREQWDLRICQASGLPLPQIALRYMTSRWGVCHLRTNQITLSTRLIHYPECGLQAVLLHEYAHLLVPRHDARFYAVVHRFMPDYEERIRVLKV